MDINPFEAIVVGSGATGGVAALTLAEKGIKVLVIEAGPQIKRNDISRRNDLSERNDLPRRNTMLDLQIKYQEHFSKSREIESNFLDCYSSAENENNPVLSLEMKNKCQAERFKTREIFNKELDNIQDEIDKLNNP